MRRKHLSSALAIAPANHAALPPGFRYTLPEEHASLTLVPPHPNRNAASCANNSPNPSINPFINGSMRFIAAPRSNPHNVGGEYSISGEDEDEGGDGDSESSWCAS